MHLRLTFLLAFVLFLPTRQSQAQVQSSEPIELKVDATDTAHKILVCDETLAVKPGQASLYFPQWLPGAHARSGNVNRLSGLHFRAEGQELPWSRDPIDGFHFLVQIPPGASRLHVHFLYLTPVKEGSGRVIVDSTITEVEWQDAVLYPIDVSARQVPVQVSVKLPAGYPYATALETHSQQNDTVTFEPTTIETLIDSPLISGIHLKRIRLNEGDTPPVYLDLIGDKPSELEPSAEALQAHKNLVTQAVRLFGTTHYAHYDFLFSISDEIGGSGLEHHQSSQDGTGLGYFSNYKTDWVERSLLPHEFVHSWNGKYRRPADLATPNYNTPMGGTLLWVYEGMTDFWGNVLEARSGLETTEQAHEYFAAIASLMDLRAGRSWRDLQDTTRDPVIGYSNPDWLSFQRSAADYYREMNFVWMQADTLIRHDTAGAKSLDDFARLFAGMEPGQVKVSTYKFEDVVAGLTAIDPKPDWQTFFSEKLSAHRGQPGTEALAQAGWRLVYTDEENQFMAGRGKQNKELDCLASIGLDVGEDGKLSAVQWGGPAFNAGAIPGLQVLAVNNQAYSGEVLKQAISASRGNQAPIALLVKEGTLFRVINVDYHDGLRWPHLARDEAVPDTLTALLAARTQ